MSPEFVPPVITDHSNIRGHSLKVFWSTTRRSTMKMGRMAPHDRSPSPLSMWVFLVGNCAEYPDYRSKYGDERMYYAFLDCGIPPSQVVWLKDGDHCTRLNCQRQFQRLLRRTKAGDTLVFYYGGHGLPDSFETNEESWLHRDIVQCIEQNFRGNKVWMLIDCCHAGAFVKSLPNGVRDNKVDSATTTTTTATTNDSMKNRIGCNGTRISYLCIMAVPDSLEAGPEWTFTGVFIDGMVGTFSDKVDDSDADDDEERGSRRVLSTNTVLTMMADQCAYVKHNQVLVFLSPNDNPRGGTVGIDPMAPFPFVSTPGSASKIQRSTFWNSWFPRVVGLFLSTLFRQETNDTHNAEKDNNEKKDGNVDRDEGDDDDSVIAYKHEHPSWRQNPVPHQLQVGHCCFAAWKGGVPDGQYHYEPPTYHEARVLAIRNDDDDDTSGDNEGTYSGMEISVRMNDTITGQEWITAVDATTIIDRSYFLNDYDRMVNANIALARHGRYIDFSVKPSRLIWSIWDDHNELYPGRIMELPDTPWEDILDDDGSCGERYDGWTGPFLAVYWYEEDTHTFVPKGHTVFQEDEDGNKNTKPTVEFVRQQAAEAFRANNNSTTGECSKALSPKEAALRSLEVSNKCIVSIRDLFENEDVSGWWDGEWYNVIESPSRSPDVILSHLAFPQTGEYCVVKWEGESFTSIIPKDFLRNKRVTRKE